MAEIQNDIDDWEEYAPDAVACDPPTASEWSTGAKVGYTLPAKWWNYFFNSITNRWHAAHETVSRIISKIGDVSSTGECTIMQSIEGKAPINHAVDTTSYGVGNAANYGHVQLSESVSSTYGVGCGVAATPSSVKSAYDLANCAYTCAQRACYANTAGSATTATCASKDSSGCSFGTAARYNCTAFQPAGTYMCISKDTGGYYGLSIPPDGAGGYVRTTSSGFIPDQAGAAGSGHATLGTAYWYFATAYIDHVYGSCFHGTATNADTANAARATITAGGTVYTWNSTGCCVMPAWVWGYGTSSKPAQQELYHVNCMCVGCAAHLKDSAHNWTATEVYNYLFCGAAYQTRVCCAVYASLAELAECAYIAGSATNATCATVATCAQTLRWHAPLLGTDFTCVGSCIRAVHSFMFATCGASGLVCHIKSNCCVSGISNFANNYLILDTY